MYSKGDIIEVHGISLKVVGKIWSNRHTYDGTGIGPGDDYENLYILQDHKGNLVEIEESSLEGMGIGQKPSRPEGYGR